MRRILKALAWLYPRAWRARYGDELQVLLEDMEPRWSDVWNLLGTSLQARGMAMRSWQWIGLGTIVGFTVHAGMMLHYPAHYLSLAQVKVHGSGSYPEVESHVEKVLVASMNRAWLVPVIQRHHLYEVEMASGHETDAVQDLSRRLMFDGFHEADGVRSMQISLSTEDPQQSQAVVRDVYEQVVQVAKLQSAPVEFELTVEPNLPSHSSRWYGAPKILGGGAVAGAACGLLAVLIGRAWRKFAAKG